jgi:hypothetical protein
MKYGIVTITILILLGGCDQPKVDKKDTTKTRLVKQTYLPPPPKKKMKLKKVDDTNFDSAYMYPEDTKKKEKVETLEQTTIAATDIMDKEECIAMITQEKFDKYAAMFGSEDASIKRCKMLKATR